MGNKFDYSQQVLTFDSNELQLISFNLPKDKYFHNDTVIGEIILQPIRNILISRLEIKLNSQEGWIRPIFLEQKNTTLNNEVFHLIIDLTKYFPHENGIVTFIPNKYTIPFSFTISQAYSPSFRYPLQTITAFLSHSITAELTSIIGEKWSYSHPIAIISLYNPPKEPHITVSTKEVYMMNLFSLGSNTIKVTFPHIIYQYNDNIKFDIFIDNSQCTGTVNGISIALMRKVAFKLNGTEVYKVEKQINEQYVNEVVKEKTQKKIEGEIKFINVDMQEFQGSNIDMYLPKVDDLNQLVTSIGTSLILCEYSLHLKVLYSGMTNNDKESRMIIPIFTGKLKQQQQQQQEQPQLHQGNGQMYTNKGPITDDGDTPVINKEPIFEDINKIHEDY